MSRNFELLKGLETQPLPTMDANSNIRVMPSSAAILADELAQIERIVGHSIGKLKAVVEEGAAAVRSEKEVAEQTIAALKADGALLTSKLRDAERSLHSRSDEVNDLSAKLQLLTSQVAHLSQSLQQAKSDAASEVQRATADVENAKAKVAQLESRLRDKDALIAESDNQIGELKSEVSRLKDGMLEMASFVTMRAKIITDGNANKRVTAAPEPVSPTPTQPIYSQVSNGSLSALFDR